MTSNLAITEKTIKIETKNPMTNEIQILIEKTSIVGQILIKEVKRISNDKLISQERYIFDRMDKKWRLYQTRV